ncbi:GntP family permease [Brevibacterium oceani]|uniref:GntP family permease n=1 Tax=Brevibacterium oceani TaxID=358099 RepID=UPI0015E762C6|nr:SLC13 family permease [Brevibacterium oceani]
MSDVAIIVNTAIAVVATVVLIVRFKVNPVVSLVIGSLYLGLITGMGVKKTVETITSGFGDIMVDLGLLIAFGILMGSILNATGAISRLVDGLLRIFGARGIPYALGTAVGTVLQSIFVDVLLVISAPLAHRVGQRIGRFGTPKMAVAMAVGLECGIVFTVPGVGALALAGLLHVPLGKMLVFGVLVVVPTILATIAITSFLFSRGWWKEDRDERNLSEDSAEAAATTAESASTADASGTEAIGALDRTPQSVTASAGGSTTPVGTHGHPAHRSANAESGPTASARTSTARVMPLWVLFGPLLASLLFIAGGAVADIAGFTPGWVLFLGEPTIALLIGLIGTMLVAYFCIGSDGIEDAITSGFRESGQILLLTGVGGSLAAVVTAAGMGDILGEFFSASTVAPLLVVWGIAAILHIAVGSVTLSAITAAGLLAPVAPSIGLDPVLIALAAGAGSLFIIHVTSNTFWLLQTLLGQTVRGALKTVTVGLSIASVIALLCILVISLFM